MRIEPTATIERRIFSGFPCAVFALAMLLGTGRIWGASEWWNNRFSYRMPVTVQWDTQHAGGDEIAEVRFYCHGHMDHEGKDVRVTTEAGTLVPSRLLMYGPGDALQVAFNLSAGVTKYDVYFGCADPPAVPTSLPEFKVTRGLLLETRKWSGDVSNTADRMQSAWENSGALIGRTLVDSPFVGGNPFGDDNRTISRYSGELTAPGEGDYLFAAAASSRGALFIDKVPLIFAPAAIADIRFNHIDHLLRGKHEFAFYQIRENSPAILSVGWKPPGTDKVQVMGRDAFGVLGHGTPEGMEQFGKKITADFSVDYVGECFTASHYSHRYKFSAPINGQSISVRWDFGDGQHSDQSFVEHVFMTEQTYNVRVTFTSGSFSDTQSSQVAVSRDWPQIVSPPTDLPIEQSRIVEQYTVENMPPQWLPWVAMLHLRAGNQTPMEQVAARMASIPKHPDPAQALDALQEITQNGIQTKLSGKILAAWDSVPQDSDLQPRAAAYYAQLLMWWPGDFAKALKVLDPLASKARPEERELERVYAQALILNQHAEQGRRILNSLPPDGDPHRRPAMAGALARSIEFYIDQKDAESAEDAWAQWQEKYPADFLEGYSMVLRVQFMALKPGRTTAAANAAIAFATALPQSTYSPQLLDMASKLLAKSDPQKSKEIHELLKQRYPEDPLSQQ